MELIRVPKVAEAVTEGTVSLWHVAVGDRVEADRPLVEMITEKAEDDVRSPADGRVAAIHASERSTVPVGYVLCVLAEEGEELPDVKAINAEVLRRHRAALLGELPAEQVGSSVATPDETLPESGSEARRIPASPAARRLAREKGLELSDIAAGLGIDGQLSEGDVRRFLEGAE